MIRAVHAEAEPGGREQRAGPRDAHREAQALAGPPGVDAGARRGGAVVAVGVAARLGPAIPTSRPCHPDCRRGSRRPLSHPTRSDPSVPGAARRREKPTESAGKLTKLTVAKTAAPGVVGWRVPERRKPRRDGAFESSGRCWARTSDLRLVEAALSQLS